MRTENKQLKQRIAELEKGIERTKRKIEVSDSLLTKKYGLYEDDCVLGIAAYSKRIDSVEMFLDFLYSDDGEGGDDVWE